MQVPDLLLFLACFSNKGMDWRANPPYQSDFQNSKDSVVDPPKTKPIIYQASCFCGRVKYDVLGEPESSKLCHCRGCQLLHGAPFEWVSIFHKHNVRFHPDSLDYLYFYSGEQDVGYNAKIEKNAHGPTSGSVRPSLPLKVSCCHCRTPIADEGRHMWLAFTTLFGFTVETGIPSEFQHGSHLFYGQRCVDMNDDKPKWNGHKNKSSLWQG